MSEQKDIEKLNFVRVIDPNVFQLIPRSLFEQVKEIDGEAIDRIYQYGSSILTIVVPGEQGLVRVPNPTVHIAVLIDDSHKIQGFLWAKIDVIEQQIFVQACSVDKKYQSNNGELFEKVKDYLLNLPIANEFKQKVCWSTIHPKAFERRGFKRSKRILLEYQRDEPNSRSKRPVQDGMGGKTEPEVPK